MESWFSMSPYTRPLLGLLAIVFVFLLIRFMIKQVFAMAKFVLFLALVAIALFFYYDYKGYFGPVKAAGASAAGADFSVESEAEQTTQRQLLAQIVDTEAKDEFAERAILEGRAYKYLLNKVSKTTREKLVNEVNDRTTFENLTDEGDFHRGEPYAPGRGVIVEVSNAELGPEYGLPGWTVLPAIFVNTAHEIYALRMLCPPGSKVFEKLDKGIKEDKLPVVNMAGLFFKNYARQPGDLKEQPWVKPLMVCPEIEFVTSEEPREVMKELQDTGYSRMLPTKRVDGLPTEQRLVLDVSYEQVGIKLRAFGANAADVVNATGSINAFMADAVAKLKQRLPGDQAAHPAAVIVLKSGLATDPRLKPVTDALKAAGVTRVCVKLDAVKSNATNLGK